jgi:hypothetical protein
MKQFNGCYNPFNLQAGILGAASLPALKAQYAFVGIQDELYASVCLASIVLLHKVPARCNCTGLATSVLDSRLRTEQATHHGHDHGVKHHGSRYVATAEESSLIANLTVVDQRLYAAAIQMFNEKLKEVQGTFNFKLCLAEKPPKGPKKQVRAGARCLMDSRNQKWGLPRGRSNR